MTNQTITIGLLGIIGIIVLTGLSVNDAFAAGFLKFDGVDGESVARGHDKWIDIESWDFGVTQTGYGGGGASGKVQFQDFHFSKRIDKSSPKLFEALTTGKHIKDVTLELCRESEEGQSQCYLIMKFEDIVITSYQTGAHSGDTIPTDHVSFNFAKMVLEYKPQKPDGSLDAPVKAGYDLKKNVKV